MNFLDVRTIMFSHIVIDAVCTVVLAFLWLQNRKHFAGTAYWLGDFVLQTTSAILVVLHGSIPDWISMTLANTLVLVGAWLGYMGLLHFAGKKSRQIHNYVLLVVFAAMHSYFVLVKPNLATRNVLLSLGLLILCFQCMWFVLRRAERGMRRMMQEVGLVFGVFCLVSLIRIAVVFISPPPSNDFFHSGLYDTLVLLAFQILLIFLAFNLVLMVNRRLLSDIRVQEEKFAKAFRSSPYAITLTRARDGQIIEVNKGFENITGYSQTEVIGKTTVDLQLWVHEEERVAIVGELSKGNQVVEREFQFRKKSGEILTGLFSAEPIVINDQSWILSSINDVSERVHAEAVRRQAKEELIASEVRYRRLFEAAQDGILILDAESGMIVDVNPFLSKLLGLSPETFLNKKVWELGPLKDIIANQARFAELQQKEYVRYEDLPLETGGGQRIDVEFVSNVYLVDHRKVIQCNIRDITERKQAEGQLRENEKVLRTIAANYPHSYVSIIERDLTIGFTSGQEFHKQNLDPEQFIGLSIEQVFGDQTPVVRERYLKTFAGQEQSFELSINGQYQLYRAVPLYAEDGTIPRILSVVENITERKQVEEEIVSLAKFPDENPSPVLRVAQDGTILYANAGSQSLLEFWNTQVNRQVPADWKDLVVDALTHNTIQAVPVEYNDHILAFTLVPVAEARYVNVYGLDITERKRAEEALQTYSEQLETMVAERTRALEETQAQLVRQMQLSVLGQLSGSIAHELRTPLGAIKNTVYLLTMLLETADAQTQEALDILAQQIKISEQIINNLLDFARTRRPQKQSVDLNQVLGQALSRLNVPDEVRVEQDLADLLFISADPGQLGQILGNLMLNAIQAMPEGGQLKIKTYRLGPERVATEITDTGVGIPTENISRLFEPMFTTKSKGIGLGLALVKMLVEAHDGDIQVVSAVGQGSTFTVELPIYR
jgi:PAS domain S-box-containing protein